MSWATPELLHREGRPDHLPVELRFYVREVVNRDFVTVIVADDFHGRTWTAVHPDNDAWLHITTGNGELIGEVDRKLLSARGEAFVALVEELIS